MDCVKVKHEHCSKSPECAREAVLHEVHVSRMILVGVALMQNVFKYQSANQVCMEQLNPHVSQFAAKTQVEVE